MHMFGCCNINNECFFCDHLSPSNIFQAMLIALKVSGFKCLGFK